MSLTSAERMVLELVREGRFDAEIAVRLGLTNEEVKRRIASICTKLGVADRAALRGDIPAGVPVTEEREDWSPVIDYTDDPLPREKPDEPAPAIAATDRRPFAAIAGMLLAIGVAAFAAWLAFGRDGSNPEGAPEPGVSLTDDPGTILSQQIPDVLSTQMATYVEPDPGLLAVPATLIGTGPRTLVSDFDMLADTLTGTSRIPVPGSRDTYRPAALPGGVEVIIAGQATGSGDVVIQRAFTGADGSVVVEPLFTTPDGSNTTNIIASPNGASLAVAVCAGCARLRPDEVANVELEIFRSDDAGVTWERAGSRRTAHPIDWTLVGFVPGDIALRKALQPPELLSNGDLACGATSSPFFGQGAGQALVFQDSRTDDIVDCGGVITLAPGLSGRLVFDAFRAGPEDLSAMSWHTADAPRRSFVGDFAPGDSAILEVPRAARVAGWLADGRAIGDIRLSDDGSISPAILDFEGTITLLAPPLRAVPASLAAGQEWREQAPRVLEVLAVRQGTNATISLPGGIECAPLMPLTLDPREPNVGCLAEGVRVEMSAGSATIDSDEWAVVGVPTYDPACRSDCAPARALVLRAYLR